MEGYQHRKTLQMPSQLLLFGPAHSLLRRPVVKSARPPSPTFQEFADRWLEDYAGPPYRARYIQKNRRAVLRLYVIPTLGGLRLSEIGPAEITNLQHNLLMRDLALSTVRCVIGVFSEVWKRARQLGIARGMPHADLIWPRQRKRPVVFTAEERDTVLTGLARAQRNHLPMVAGVFLAGMRPSEAAALRWCDADPETGRVEITRAIVAGEVTKCKTDDSIRTIIVSNRLVRTWRECRPPGARMHDLMAVDPHGDPIDTHRFSYVNLKPVLKRLFVPYRPLYTARHTYITLALMSGASPQEVAEYCGTSIMEIEKSYLSWIGAVQDPMARKRGSSRVHRVLRATWEDTETG